MKLIKLALMTTITMALSITLTIKSIDNAEERPLFMHTKEQPAMKEEELPLPTKRASRFLAETRNPRAADHCHKDNEVCYLLEGKNSTCCNNKCVDLSNDRRNCGACKSKCKFTEACCRGECVNLSYDKRHCGSCSNRCSEGEYCVYGMCSYA